MSLFQRRHIVSALMASLLGVASALPVHAQEGTPAKIIVGFPAGGSFDAIARLLADKLKTELNRPVVVDNKTGAGGRIAVDALKASPADGSVMMLGPDALTSFYPFTYKKLNYDVKKDLVPVGTVAEFAFGFAVGTAPKANTWAEYVAWAKKNPKDANYGIPALGAPANTPASAVTTWNQALAKVMALPDVKEKLNVMGFLPVGKSTQELIDRQAVSAKKWEPIIKASGFTAD